MGVSRLRFFQSVMMILNIVTTLILGIIFQLLLPCIILNLAYIPIRVNAGGHHASSPLKCYINSTVIIASLLSIIKWIAIPTFISMAILTVSSAAIFILAPVERQVFKRRTRVILFIETAVFAVLMVLGKTQTAGTIALGLLTESLMLIMGCLKNHNPLQRKK